MNDQVKFFLEALNEKFKHILSEYHIKTLSNMLGFYYSMQKSENNINNFTVTILEKLRIFIGDKKLQHDDFAVTLSLFLASITNDTGKPDNEILARDLSEIILSEIYESKDPEFKNKVRYVIKTLLSSMNIRETMNLLYNKPALFMNLIKQSINQLSNVISTINKYDIKSPRQDVKTHNLSAKKMDDLLATKNLKNLNIGKEHHGKNHIDRIKSSDKKNQHKGKGY